MDFAALHIGKLYEIELNVNSYTDFQSVIDRGHTRDAMVGLFAMGV